MRTLTYEYVEGYEEDFIEQSHPFELYTWIRGLKWVGSKAPFEIHPSTRAVDAKNALLKHHNGSAEIWAVWKYEHGEVALHLQPFTTPLVDFRWDWSHVGYLVLPWKSVLEMHGRKRISKKFQANELAETSKRRFAVVKMWEDWINGHICDVYDGDECIAGLVTLSDVETLYPEATSKEAQ